MNMRDLSLPDRNPLDTEAEAATTRISTLRARLGLWTLLLLSVFAWAPMLHPGYLHTESGFVPAFNLVQGDALANVAATADVWRGEGIAAFVPGQPLILLGMTPAAAVEVVMIISLLLGALGIYVWLRPQLGDRAAGLGGLVYLFLPTVLSTVYARGSVSAALVLALLPMILAGLASYRMQRSLVGAAVAALAILWLWRTQAGVAAAASVMLFFYAIFVERHWGALLLVAVSAVAGFISLLPIWGIVDPAASTFTAHLGTLYGLLSATPGAAGANEMVQIGIVAFLFAVMAAWGLFMEADPLYASVRRLVGFCVVGTLVLLALTLIWCAPFWNITGLARYFSAPWQIALLAAPLLAAVAGALVIAFPVLQRHTYWAAMAILIILSAQSWLAPRYTTLQPPTAPLAIVGDNRIAILHATVTENDATRQAQLEVTWQVLQPLDFDYSIFVQAIGTGEGASGEGEAGEVRLAQYDGAPLADLPATAWQPGDLLTATYTIDLPADPPIDAYYYGWYDWRDGTRLRFNMGLNDKLVFYAQ